MNSHARPQVESRAGAATRSRRRTALAVIGRAVPIVVAVSLMVGLAPAQASEDLTVTRTAKSSQHYRKSIDLRTWRASPHGRAIVQRESNNVCDAVNPAGYYGKWQMSLSLWRAYGGRNYARTPARARCIEQDRVAHKVWIRNWWLPWGG